MPTVTRLDLISMKLMISSFFNNLSSVIRVEVPGRARAMATAPIRLVHQLRSCGRADGGGLALHVSLVTRVFAVAAVLSVRCSPNRRRILRPKDDRGAQLDPATDHVPVQRSCSVLLGSVLLDCGCHGGCCATAEEQPSPRHAVDLIV
jgi:hypothetical protein